MPRSILLSAALCLSLAGQAFAQEAPVSVTGSVPVVIDIPKIGAHAPVLPLGEEEDGTMQAPTDPDTVGWYALGSGLGTPGNALLDGHVDWAGTLRAFGMLRQLGPGDVVQITDADGHVFEYNVQWTKMYDSSTAPLDEIFDPTPDEEVTLITCGGAFDTSIHMYLSRVVVRAARVSAD